MQSSRLLLVLVTAALALAFAVPAAGAATIDLACAGKGPHNRDSAGTALCAAEPNKARVVSGVLRDDAGKPAAGKVKVTFATWTPAPGGGFTIKSGASETVSAAGNGQFSVPVKTETKVTVYFESVADEKAGIGPVKAQADVSRRLDVKVAKLGGGKVKVTVKGGGANPLELYLLDESGYELPGVKPKKANKAGSAVFDLGNFHGKFTYYVDAGVLSDLFWEERRPTFHA